MLCINPLPDVVRYFRHDAVEMPFTQAWLQWLRLVLGLGCFGPVHVANAMAAAQVLACHWAWQVLTAVLAMTRVVGRNKL